MSAAHFIQLFVIVVVVWLANFTFDYFIRKSLYSAAIDDSKHIEPAKATKVTQTHPWFISDAMWTDAQADIEQHLGHISSIHRRRCENVLRGSRFMGFSQAWQDWLLYRNFFAGQKKGLYVDIGTNAPIRISNTFFFDHCLGWDGICFEADATYHAGIRYHRTCQLVESCVLGRPSNQTFYGSGQVLSYRQDDTVKSHQKQAGNGNEEVIGRRELQCVGILEEITRLGLRGRVIDLLNIDIEGAEPLVLNCLPFDQLDIRYILIETNKVKDLRYVDNFFHNHGYANIASLLNLGQFLDNIYAKMPQKLITPVGRPSCTPRDYQENAWCGQHTKWPRWVNKTEPPADTYQECRASKLNKLARVRSIN